MKLWKKLIISLVIIFFILTTGIIGFYSQNAGLNSPNTEMNVVAAGSMEPTLYRGDIVLVENNPSKVNVGDIVIYNATWYPERVIHRVIEIKKTSAGDLYIIKGDNNLAADPYPVKKDQIISKVKMGDNGPVVIPKIGYITLWIRGL